MAKKNKSIIELDEADKTVWNAETVQNALNAIENGYNLPVNPFFEKDISYKKADILYEYNEYELEEIKKCAMDVIYFANTYAYTMTDGGLQQIKLRDYQIDVLKAYQSNKEIAFMASRQIGKCSDANSMITIKNGDDIYEISFIDLWFINRKNSFIDYIIYYLYCIIKWLER